MSIKVQLIDKISNQVIYAGKATIEQENSMKKIMFKSDDHTYIWKIFENGLIIESLSEVHVILTLRENHRTKGHINSQFGQIDLQCETSIYKINKNYIEVVYELIQESDRQEFHFILNIFKEESYAIH